MPEFIKIIIDSVKNQGFSITPFLENIQALPAGLLVIRALRNTIFTTREKWSGGLAGLQNQ
jgi:hypothetical protein